MDDCASQDDERDCAGCSCADFQAHRGRYGSVLVGGTARRGCRLTSCEWTVRQTPGSRVHLNVSERNFVIFLLFLRF